MFTENGPGKRQNDAPMKKKKAKTTGCKKRGGTGLNCKTADGWVELWFCISRQSGRGGMGQGVSNLQKRPGHRNRENWKSKEISLLGHNDQPGQGGGEKAVSGFFGGGVGGATAKRGSTCGCSASGRPAQQKRH